MIKIISESNGDTFERLCNELITKGYKVLSTFCATVVTEEYEYQDVWQAILEKNNLQGGSRMKYSNLLYFLLTWGDFREDLVNKQEYEHAMNDNCASVKYRTELRKARKELLKYLKEKDD